MRGAKGSQKETEACRNNGSIKFAMFVTLKILLSSSSNKMNSSFHISLFSVPIFLFSFSFSFFSFSGFFFSFLSSEHEEISVCSLLFSDAHADLSTFHLLEESTLDAQYMSGARSRRQTLSEKAENNETPASRYTANGDVREKRLPEHCPYKSQHLQVVPNYVPRSADYRNKQVGSGAT